MNKVPRVTLTKAQAAESAGAELLSVCKSVTEDGLLNDHEIEELKSWLADYATTDIPAIEFLNKLVSKILQDGMVTEEERKELFLGIERVLPKNVRDTGKRKSLENQERIRNRRLATFNFMIAGACRKEYAELIEFVDENNIIYLEREPENRYDRNAIKVLAGRNYHIGYVPREEAKELAPLLDAGSRYEARVKKVLGYNHRIPVVVAKVYGSESSIEGTFISSQEIPRTGCFPVVLVMLGGLMTLTIIFL